MSGAYPQHPRRGSIVSKHSARTGAASSGRNSSVTVRTETSGTGGGIPIQEKQVIKFVYSQAVEKAFKRQYHCTQFGPVSAKPQFPPVEIKRLPEIYGDFLMIASLLESNHRHVEELRARGELIREKSVVKLPKMTFKNTVAKLKQKKRGAITSVPKLPPLRPDGNSGDTDVTKLDTSPEQSMEYSTPVQ